MVSTLDFQESAWRNSKKYEYEAPTNPLCLFTIVGKKKSEVVVERKWRKTIFGDRESMRESWTIKGDHRLPLGSLCAIGGVGNKVSSARRMELEGWPAGRRN